VILASWVQDGAARKDRFKKRRAAIRGGRLTEMVATSISGEIGAGPNASYVD
jgi:hypothetical protein